MAVSPSFREFVREQFEQVAPVTTRPMFGGLTFFHDGKAFALIDDDRLYFKADDSNRGDFEKAGCGPFLPFGDPAKPMAYYELPGEVLEDSEQLAVWMRKAFAVAARAHTKAPARKPKR
jgi:DNA transformation protein